MKVYFGSESVLSPFSRRILLKVNPNLLPTSSNFQQIDKTSPRWEQYGKSAEEEGGGVNGFNNKSVKYNWGKGSVSQEITGVNSGTN
jgi:hypothetical protein